jgi:hypothetical protein
VYEPKEPRSETQKKEKIQTHIVNPEGTRRAHMQDIVLPRLPARKRATGQRKSVRETEQIKMNWLKHLSRCGTKYAVGA